MWKIITHYNHQDVRIQTTAERDTKDFVVKAHKKEKDCVAIFVYENSKLGEFIFLVA